MTNPQDPEPAMINLTAITGIMPMSVSILQACSRLPSASGLSHVA
jgi:hypothetical protein